MHPLRRSLPLSLSLLLSFSVFTASFWSATAAFPHSMPGERWERMLQVNGEDQPHTDSLFWAGYPGVVGLPATAIPIGLGDNFRGFRIVGTEPHLFDLQHEGRAFFSFAQGGVFKDDFEVVLGSQVAASTGLRQRSRLVSVSCRSNILRRKFSAARPRQAVNGAHGRRRQCVRYLDRKSVV